MKIVRAIIKNKAGQILMVKRSMTDHYPGQWEYPGGKVDAQESIRQALVREVMEETGLRVQVTGLKASQHGRYYYYCDPVEPVEVKLSSEHSDYKWEGGE